MKNGGWIESACSTPTSATPEDPDQRSPEKRSELRELKYGSIDAEYSSLTPSELDYRRNTSSSMQNHKIIELNVSSDTMLHTSFLGREEGG